jgi:hypothetical protein
MSEISVVDGESVRFEWRTTNRRGRWDRLGVGNFSEGTLADIALPFGALIELRR